MVPPERPEQAGRVHDRRRGSAARLALDDQIVRSAAARQFGGGMVFADYDQVRRDFGSKQAAFFWMNVDVGFGRKHLDEVAGQVAAAKAGGRASAVAGQGLLAPDLVVDAKRAAVVKIGEALQPIADRYLADRQPISRRGRRRRPARGRRCGSARPTRFASAFSTVPTT